MASVARMWSCTSVAGACRRSAAAGRARRSSRSAARSSRGSREAVLDRLGPVVVALDELGAAHVAHVVVLRRVELHVVEVARSCTAGGRTGAARRRRRRPRSAARRQPAPASSSASSSASACGRCAGSRRAGSRPRPRPRARSRIIAMTTSSGTSSPVVHVAAWPPGRARVPLARVVAQQVAGGEVRQAEASCRRSACVPLPAPGRAEKDEVQLARGR